MKHHYTLICDDVRREVLGKSTLVGLYTSDGIAFVKLPGTLPQLTFVQRWTLEKGEYALEAVLISPDGANILPGDSRSVRFSIEKESMTMLLQHQVGNLEFKTPGKYTFKVQLKGPTEQSTVEHHFDVKSDPDLLKKAGSPLVEIQSEQRPT